MELLKDVAHISGKSGLYKILKPTRNGVIVETLDAKRERTVVGGNSRVSVLKDISMYTQENQEASLALGDIFQTIKAKHGGQLDLNTKTMSDNDLRDFMAEVVPNYDKERVYTSDIKKLINWYNILNGYMPEIFEVEAKDAEETT